MRIFRGTSPLIRSLRFHCRRLHAAKSVRDTVRSYKEGDKIHGYIVKKVLDVPELYLTTVALQHDKTGAQHLHAARDDDNNTFGVAFRTTPMDHTGVPHILEHTVLCGSQKFPVRDPFFKMLSRSLANFMNAFTAYDWTMYPFSTQNQQDFRNLLSVYLDAVFQPALRELDFSQEGWRLEHEDLKDQSSPFVFKGVVYNEMKGVFSSSQNLFAQACHNKLLPSHTYGVVSGGDPAFIPDLTWQHLKDFHSSHYHPSNARFFTCGNFPLDDHLEFINKTCLQNFSKIQVNTAVPDETRWQKPKEASIFCNPDPMAPDPQKQITVSVSFLLQPITDPFETFVMEMIGYLLVGSETSPFYQSLLEANIGSGYAPNTGYEGHTKEATFSVGLQGIHEKDISKVRQLINETFDKVIKEGFKKESIDAALHKAELDLKHKSSTSSLGLALSLHVISSWTHDGDPSDSLQINQSIEFFKKSIKENPNFLQEKVKHYFKNNSHSLTLTMSPDEKFEEQRQQKEQKRLQSLVSKLTEKDKEAIYTRGLRLLEKQMSAEDLSCLPTLKLTDLDPQIKPELVESIFLDGVPVVYSAQPTNEVTHVRFLSNISTVPTELKPYVPLFCDIITKMGAGSYDYKALSQEIDLYTGGLSVSPHISAHHTNKNRFEQGVLFSSRCLDKNVKKMLDLWTEIFTSPDLKDINHLMTLIKMSASDMAASLANTGHSYAMTHSASELNPACKLSELFNGVTQVSIMKRIAESEDLMPLVEHLQEIGKHILCKNNLRLSVNSTPESMPKVLQMLEDFTKDLHGHMSNKDTFTQEESFAGHPCQTQFEFPFSVNYMSKSMVTVPYTHKDFPSLQVLGNLLSRKYLHREIREKGGAYGSGAVCKDGVFSFFSYRDPNCLQTLDVFDQSIQWAVSGQFTDQDVDEAKLGVFQGTDAPVAPGQKGLKFFLRGVSDEIRQESRDKLFAVSQQNLQDAAQMYLTSGHGHCGISFLGPANSCVQETKAWKVIKE